MSQDAANTRLVPCRFTQVPTLRSYVPHLSSALNRFCWTTEL